MKKSFILLAAILLSSLSYAKSVVPECDKRPETPQGRPLPGLKSLPPMVFVGKRATYYIESKNQSTQLLGEQSFVKGESRILCASSKADSAQSFSIYAPTLIDMTGNKNVGDSYWQFHMIANAKEFGIWNQKSRLFSKANDLEEALTKIGSQVQIYQVSHSEYEMIFTRDSESTSEILTIRYEAFSKIP